MRNRVLRIVVDVGLLVGFAAEFLTREGPDYDLHSWIGVALMPLVAVHLSANWRWVKSAVKRLQAHPEWKLARFNAVFSVMTAICILTGFPIWLEWSDNDLWATVHTVTGFLSVVLALSHLWRNRQRLTTLIGRRPAAA